VVHRNFISAGYILKNLRAKYFSRLQNGFTLAQISSNGNLKENSIGKYLLAMVHDLLLSCGRFPSPTPRLPPVTEPKCGTRVDFENAVHCRFISDALCLYKRKVGTNFMKYVIRVYEEFEKLTVSELVNKF
jgi:hypothetical protein